MADIQEETQQKIRRALGLEFVRMEDDFDETREKRRKITDRLVEAAEKVILLDDKGNTREDTSTGIALMTASLKALADTEKANVAAISMKLRHSEQQAANAQMNKDRILVVLEATKPGRVSENLFDPSAMDQKLAEMFDGEIKPFETKSNPHSLTEEDD